MPSVVTLITWVSPRWKSAEPWVIGNRSSSADSGRMSVTPRPSMRTPSSTMRWRTNFLVIDLTAALISLVRSGNSSFSFSMIILVSTASASARTCLVVNLFASARALAPTAWTRANTSSWQSEKVKYSSILIGPRSATNAFTRSRCRLMASRIQSLDASSPAASTSSLTLGAPSAYFSNEPSVPPASTIMIAMSVSTESVSARPATTSSKVAGRALTDSVETDIAIMMVEAGGTEGSFEKYADGAPKVSEDVLAVGLEASKLWIREAINLQRDLVKAFVAERGPIKMIEYLTFSDYQDDVYARVE